MVSATFTVCVTFSAVLWLNLDEGKYESIVSTYGVYLCSHIQPLRKNVMSGVQSMSESSLELKHKNMKLQTLNICWGHFTTMVLGLKLSSSH